LIAASCTQKPALIVDKGRQFYGRGSENVKHKYAQKTDHTSVRRIEIKPGDTVDKIAKTYRIPVRDLIVQNNLFPPYNLKPGDKISVPEPLYHITKEGDTIYGISRKYDMSMSSIIEANNLAPPYELKVGQRIKVLRYNKVEDKTETARSEDSKFKVLESEKKNNFMWPVVGEVISKFGPKRAGLYNDGINIKAPEGTEVKAAEEGVVAYVGDELKGYGNLIIVKHSGNWITAYAHLSKAAVKGGDKVVRGQLIGYVGSTGRVNSAQLYFGLRQGKNALNPERYLG
jgi:murein DD-endopeptidase MepM/ murein hydrolase activator NlpD